MKIWVEREVSNHLNSFHPYKSGKDPTLTRYEASQVSQYPDWIDIEMQDGKTIRYKR